MAGLRKLGRLGVWATALIACTATEARAQFGIVLSGVGPVNRSMGGAAVAAPLDANGAIHWNPATMSAFGRSEIEFGLELLYPRPRVESRIDQGAFGPQFGPPFTLAGSTESDFGAVPVPTLGLIYQPCDSPWTFGLGIFAVGGIGVNYPASSSNPVLTPQAPNGYGLGAVYSNLQVMQLAPSASVMLGDGLSIGFAPTVTMAHLQADPLFITPPDDANGDGYASYPNGTHTRFTWGAGFQAGIFWQIDEAWAIGASFKSPQWLESFRFNSADELGRHRLVKFDFDYPMIISIGGAYTGIDRLTLAADVRWIDYAAADGFNRAGFDPLAAVIGVGWKSIFVVAFGVQWQATDALSLRLGYSWNENPIPNSQTFVNVPAPAIAQNTLHLGASYRVNESFTISAGWVHAFHNTIEGPMVHPVFGPLNGTWVKTALYADALIIGASISF